MYVPFSFDLRFIYTLSNITQNIQINKKTFKNWKLDLRKIKHGREYQFDKKSVYKVISENSYKMDKGIKCHSLEYNRLPEYLKIEQCAKMLGLANGRQFRRNYIDNNPDKLEGVEILIIGSTVRIEKKSFELFVKERDKQTHQLSLLEPLSNIYLTPKECAEKLGLKNGRQFVRNYIYNLNRSKEFEHRYNQYGKYKTLKRIYRESFLTYLEKLKSEKQK